MLFIQQTQVKLVHVLVNVIKVCWQFNLTVNLAFLYRQKIPMTSQEYNQQPFHVRLWGCFDRSFTDSYAELQK